MDIQEKEGLEQLNKRAITYTANINAELRAAREGVKVLEQPRLKRRIFK